MSGTQRSLALLFLSVMLSACAARSTQTNYDRWKAEFTRRHAEQAAEEGAAPGGAKDGGAKAGGRPVSSVGPTRTSTASRVLRPLDTPPVSPPSPPPPPPPSDDAVY